MQGRRAVRRRFPVLRHQRRKGTPARPGRCHVRRQVLRGAGLSEAPTGDIYVFPDVMEDGSNHITPVFQQVLETADANGAGPGADMAAMQKSLAESGRVAIYGVYFDTDKAVVKPESKAALDEMGKLLNANPNLKVYVVSHRQPGHAGRQYGPVAKSAPTPWSRRWRRATRSRPRFVAARRGVVGAGGRQRRRGRLREEPPRRAGQPVTTRHRGMAWCKAPEPRGSGFCLMARAGPGLRPPAAGAQQDAAVLVVVHLDRRVDAQQHGHVLLGTVPGDRQSRPASA